MPVDGSLSWLCEARGLAVTGNGVGAGLTVCSTSFAQCGVCVIINTLEFIS